MFLSENEYQKHLARLAELESYPGGHEIFQDDPPLGLCGQVSTDNLPSVNEGRFRIIYKSRREMVLEKHRQQLDLE